jgi:hypothetical protein
MFTSQRSGHLIPVLYTNRREEILKEKKVDTKYMKRVLRYVYLIERGDVY